jgi:hypothetical protein
MMTARPTVQMIMTHIVLGLRGKASLSVRRDGRASPLTGLLRVLLSRGGTSLPHHPQQSGDCAHIRMRPQPVQEAITTQAVLSVLSQGAPR